MRPRLRRLLLGLSVHVLVSVCVLAGIRVFQSGYNHTHAAKIEAASLRISDDTASLSVLSHTLTVQLPQPGQGIELLGIVLVDDGIRLWYGVLSGFINSI